VRRLAGQIAHVTTQKRSHVNCWGKFAVSAAAIQKRTAALEIDRARLVVLMVSIFPSATITAEINTVVMHVYDIQKLYDQIPEGTMFLATKGTKNTKEKTAKSEFLFCAFCAFLWLNFHPTIRSIGINNQREIKS
jgi:hypothetical protein